MKRNAPLTYIDWNGLHRDSHPNLAARQGHAFYRERTSRRLRGWEVAVIAAAAVFAAACIVWAGMVAP